MENIGNVNYDTKLGLLTDREKEIEDWIIEIDPHGLDKFGKGILIKTRLPRLKYIGNQIYPGNVVGYLLFIIMGILYTSEVPILGILWFTPFLWIPFILIVGGPQNFILIDLDKMEISTDEKISPIALGNNPSFVITKERLYGENEFEVKLSIFSGIHIFENRSMLSNHSHRSDKYPTLKCEIHTFVIDLLSSLIQKQLPVNFEDLTEKNPYRDEIQLKLSNFNEFKKLRSSKYQCFHCHQEQEYQGLVCIKCGKVTPNCVVCYQDPKDGDTLVSFGCCLSYAHLDHAKDWLSQTTKCPYCLSKNPELLVVI